MDKFYNEKDARDALQTSIVESRQIQRYRLVSKPAWLGKASMMSVDKDRTWRMVETDNENQLEEMVFTLQGIIAKKDLPLINDIPLRDNYGFLQQNGRLTGLGCQAFKDTADTILEAQLVFERQFPKGMFQRRNPDNTDDNMSINISNCYLKSCRIHPQEEASFEKGVGPKSILAAACTKRDLIHTEANKVKFFTSNIDDEGERRFDAAEPQIFRPGDFIEVQPSIIAVAMKDCRMRRGRPVLMSCENATVDSDTTMEVPIIAAAMRMRVQANMVLWMLKRRLFPLSLVIQSPFLGREPDG
ncbi:hypothetical protein ARMGADRAFT_1081439 [Armillaria gallica]|uniref:Uncharacterized protein n=1 Tax=Armillaria gallica TaxID=47427 RepID=A0A2H3D9X1_ARMGA|nr:hypothetical protein ARMGADRAFT_1081439 [Armillaria gallica]